MSKLDIPVTTAIRELKSKKIDYEAFLYDYEEKGGTRQTASILNVDEHYVVKTLVFEADSNLIIVLMHGDREVSTKELARELGVKKIEQSDEKKAMNATGYMFGGTSPFGTRKKMPIYIEQSILDLENIYINGGKRGLIVKINSSDLVKIIDFETVHVSI
jgi:Cys-tRNA(Pro) deacylase